MITSPGPRFTFHVLRFTFLPALLAACLKPPVHPPPPAVPTPNPGIVYEEDLRPVEKTRIEIIDLRETPSPDKARMTITGTLINRGTKTTSELSVRVEALDEAGDVVLGVSAVPDTERIAPGATGTFAVTFDHRPGVTSYHVEAIAR